MPLSKSALTAQSGSLLWRQPVKLDTGDGPSIAGCVPRQRSRIWPDDGLNCWEATAHLLAVAMVLMRKAWKKHSDQFWMILNEITVIRNPEQLAEIAAKRKSSMLLLPYGIPIAIGTIVYFLWAGLLI